jgi:hypothetical protein
MAKEGASEVSSGQIAIIPLSVERKLINYGPGQSGF